MSNIFLSEPWVSAVAEDVRFAHAHPVKLSSGTIYVREFSLLGFKQWSLYAAIAGEGVDGDAAPSKDLPQNIYEEINGQLAFGRSIDGLKELITAGCQEKVAMINCQFNMARWQNIEMLQPHVQIIDHFGTYIIDLNQTEDTLWTAIHSKHRNVIRRAIRESVEVRFELDLEEFKALLDQTYARGQVHNRSSLRHLERITQNLGDNLLTAGAYYQGELQAGIMVPYDDRCGYYLHGATAQQNMLGSSNLLHWESIKALKAQGVQHYDMGGARETTDDPRLQGIFRFKKRFGGDFVPCYYWQKVLNPTFYKLFQRLLAVKKALR